MLYSGLPDVIPVRRGVVLRRYRPDDLDALVAEVNASLDHLRPWMAWASGPQTRKSMAGFVEQAVAGFVAGKEFQYAVIGPDGGLRGGCGLHSRQGPGVLEIGYWIGARYGHQGLGTALARALTLVAGRTAGVERVEIRCDATNLRSAAIPRKLGYRLLRVERRPPTAPAETDWHHVWSLNGAEAAALDGPLVTAVSRSGMHDFHKHGEDGIRLLAGLGVEGDAHAGETVQHLSRRRRDPTAPNLRQVHLIHAELLDELRAAGFSVAPGQLGENVTTAGLDLLGLPTGTRLHLGTAAVVEVTGLRNPCVQLDRFQPGLMAAVLDRDEDGCLVRKAGVMGVVLVGGQVRPGDDIRIERPVEPYRPLAPV